MSASPLGRLVEVPVTETDTSRADLERHRRWLADAARTAAFCEAVAAAVRPGAVFADLGCGTGLLSLVARRAGARRAFAVERGAIIGLARQIVGANHATDIEFIHGESTDVTLPEPADVVAMDSIGDAGYSPSLVACLCDARERWLRPGGVMIPASIDICGVVIEAPDHIADVPLPERGLAPLDLAGVSRLSALTLIGRTTFATADPSHIAFDATLVVTRPGAARGLGLCFSAVMLDRDAPIVLTNDPAAPVHSVRDAEFLPFGAIVPVTVGDCVHVRFTANAVVDSWRYEITVATPQGAVRHAHTVRSAQDAIGLDVARLAPDDVPSLHAVGVAARDVLTRAANGVASADLAAWVVTQHATVASRPVAARQFVRDCLSAPRRRR